MVCLPKYNIQKIVVVEIEMILTNQMRIVLKILKKCVSVSVLILEMILKSLKFLDFEWHSGCICPGLEKLSLAAT